MARPWQSGRPAFAAMAMAAALTHVAPAHCGSLSREARERAEVRAIFAMLLRRLEPGDGWGHDLPCVFSGKWEGFVHEDGRVIHPAPSLSPREALDPRDMHAERFCDIAARNAQAREMAKGLSDGRIRIVTADMTFSYPIFSRNFTRAVLQHTGGNDSFAQDGKTDFVYSWRNVYLRKRNGTWIARFKTMGIAN